MLKVIQIGYGYWGENIAKNLVSSEKFEFVGLCEMDEQRRQKAKDNLPEYVDVQAEYEVFLERSDVDAFIIATQTEYTFKIAMDAMEQGKHIFIEKPIATIKERAEKLRDKAYEKNVIIHCDHIMIYHPVIKYIKNMIDSGELGSILYFDISRLNLGPIRTDVNAMMDLAVHDLAVIDFLSDGKEPTRVAALGGVSFGKQEALTYLTLSYDTFIAHMTSSWVSPFKQRKTIIAGSKKMIIFDDMKNEKLSIYDCGIEVGEGNEHDEHTFSNRFGDIYTPNIPFEDALRNSLEYFENCVRTNTQSISGSEQSIRVMKILELAQIDLKI